MPGASRVGFATVVKAWSAPTTWPAAVVTTRRKCTVVPGFSLRSLAVTGCGPVTAASGWTAVQRRPAVASPSSNATWPATPPVSTVARSVAAVFETPVLLGTGYETTAGRGAGSAGSGAAGGGVQVETAAADTPAGAEPTSSAVARSAAIPIVGVASLMVAVGRRSGFED